MLYALEARTLLSSSLSNGILTIIGSNSKADVVGVSLVTSTKLKVTEAGLADKFYTQTAVQKIKIDVKGGNDKVTVGTSVTKSCTILGGSGNDSLVGGNKADSIDGGSGDDTLDGNLGNDTLIGLLGFDTVDYSHRSQSITAQTHAYEDWGDVDELGSGGQSGENDSYGAIERILGGSGKDKLQASSNVARNFELVGGSGNDTLVADGGNMSNPPAPGGNGIMVSLRGGAGDDSLIASGNIDSKMYGESGNDTLSTDSTIDGEDGTTPPSIADGGSGTDLFKLYPISARNQTGSMTFSLGDGLENLHVNTWSTGKNLKVVGNNLDNHIELHGGAKIELEGRGGNDQIAVAHVAAFSDSVKTAIIHCGSGNDVVFSNSPVTVYGEAGNDQLSGSNYADSLFGGDGNDSLYGGQGKDYLSGGSGNDRLYAGDGNDLIVANDGSADTIEGGAGTDTAYVDSKDHVIQVEVI